MLNYLFLQRRINITIHESTCTELALQSNDPVLFNFDIDYIDNFCIEVQFSGIDDKQNIIESS
jgi:hypothetical protein